jgi:hypothetical protein
LEWHHCDTFLRNDRTLIREFVSRAAKEPKGDTQRYQENKTGKTDNLKSTDGSCSPYSFGGRGIPDLISVKINDGNPDVMFDLDFSKIV